MSLYEYKTNLPYGVIETTKTGRVIAWNEKPEIKANINMGCYVMEPGVLDLIPKGIPYGMDDVIKKAITKKKIVNSIVSKDQFLDIGDKASYLKANQEYLQKIGKI